MASTYSTPLESLRQDVLYRLFVLTEDPRAPSWRVRAYAAGTEAELITLLGEMGPS